MINHQPGYTFHPDAVPRLYTATCPCGWSGAGPARMSTEHMAAMDAAISAHCDDVINPVVKAKIDELVETGNQHGVTPELMADVMTVLRAEPAVDCMCGYDGGDKICIDGRVYEPCGDEYCPGACIDLRRCGCQCHRE